ncbi:MAG: DUF3099 domain-containing protein [Actinobacteria bacterium]|jgi:hypothetical protein|nr:DUF3099 domain-containing protein [Actinomycetota bacterium]
MATEPEVYAITNVQSGTSNDQKSRQRSYLIGMGLRTLCFVLAIITHGTLRWILVAGAILLPYFSVVIANAGRERGMVSMPSMFAKSSRKAINSSNDSAQ